MNSLEGLNIYNSLFVKIGVVYLIILHTINVQNFILFYNYKIMSY